MTRIINYYIIIKDSSDNMNREKLWLFAGIILSVLIISGSISYAFFTASITHSNQEAMVIESGNMRLKYSDGTDNIVMENAIPGASATKTFSVENIGNVTTIYDINFTDVLNTFVDQNDLIYSITSTEANINKNNQKLPSESKTIFKDVEIEPNVVHNYTLTITFVNRNKDQNNEQGKMLNMKIGVNEINYYPIANLDRGNEVNIKFKKLVNTNNENIYYYTIDNNINVITKATSLDNTKDYVDIASSTSRYPVYAWYDVVNDKGILYIYSDAEKIYLNSDSNALFYYLQGLETIDLSIFDSSKVTNMNNIFCKDSNITSLDLSSWDTSSVTNMSYAFSQMFSLNNITYGNSFNTSNVTNMSYMFASDTSLTSLDLSKFDTSNVTNMSGIFYNLSGLTSINLSSLNTSSVTNMASMFSGMTNLTSLDLSSFDTSNVTNMSSMFKNTNKITSLDLSSLDTSKVTNMAGMFWEMESLTSLDVRPLETNSVTNMFLMFGEMTNIRNIDLTNFNTSNVTNMGGMFYKDINLIDLDVSSFNTSNVTNFCYGILDSNALYVGMFENVESLTSIDLSSFDTSKATNMCSMFKEMKNIKVLDISSFDTSKVTQVTGSTGDSGIFNKMFNVETIYVGNKWDVSSINTNKNIFDGNIKLVGGNGTQYDETHIDISYAHVDAPGDPGYLTLKTNN